MANCEECKIINSLNNAWRALCKQYSTSRYEEIRCSLNLLAKIIGKVETEFSNIKKENEPHQITIDEWLEFIRSE